MIRPGGLRLLDTNVDVYKDIIPRLHAAAPQSLVLVVTDPPDSAGRCSAHAGA
jgi:L-lactate dehydrogenase